MTHDSGVRFRLNVVGTPLRCTSKVEETLFRIGHEAISNAIRHAEAGHIDMDLFYDESSVTLRITDDGCGFDFSASTKLEKGWGLASMRERAQQIDAPFKIMTRPGGGTSVEVIALSCRP